MKQDQYVASLDLAPEREKKASKQQRSHIQELQESSDELEQYSRGNSVEIHGIPEDIGISTNAVVCEVASTVGVQIAPENIEISHRLYLERKEQNRSLPIFQMTRTTQSYIKQVFNS